MKKTAPQLKPHHFKKGQSGNPRGRPILSPEQKALRELTLETYREVIRTALTGNIQALKDLAENPDTPAIQVGVATAIMRAIKDGDPSVLERFAARIVGKIPDDIRITTTGEITVNAKISMADDAEIKARLAKIRADV